MKKIVYIFLIIITHQVYAQDVKKQIEANNAEIKKLVLATPGAPELIKQIKDMKKQREASRSPELKKLYQEFQELEIKDCIVAESNPDVKKMYKRRHELIKINTDLTKNEQDQLQNLIENWSAEAEGQKKYGENYDKLQKKIAEKTITQTKEINDLDNKIDKLTGANKSRDKQNKIRELERGVVLFEDVVKLYKLENQLDELFTKQTKIGDLRRKNRNLYKQLSIEEQCSLLFPGDAVVRVLGIDFST